MSDRSVRPATDLRVDLGLQFVALASFVLIFALGNFAFFLLGLAASMAIVAREGGLRFRRTRSWAREVGTGLWRAVRLKRPSKRSLRIGGIVLGVVAALVLLNQLRLSAPGQGRGISIAVDGATLDGAVSSAGQGAAGTFVLALLFAVIALGWWTTFRRVSSTGKHADRMTYLVLLGIFAALPLVFWLFTLAFRPTDPKEEAAVEGAAYIATGIAMSVAYVAASLPVYFRRRGTPTSPPVASAAG